MKKHNLFVDSTEQPFVSQGSLSDSRTPPTSSPASPAKTATSQRPAPTSPLLGNGGPVSQQQEATPITAKEAEAESPGPAPDAEGPAPSSEVTAQAEHVVDHTAALSLNCAGTGTDGMVEDRVMATAQQQVTDRAVYLRCPTEIKESSIACMDRSVEDDTVMADHVKVKDSASFPLTATNSGSGVNDSLPGKNSTVFESEVEIRESTEEPSPEVKDGEKTPQEGLEDNAGVHPKPSLESGTVHHVPCVEEESSTVHHELCAEKESEVVAASTECVTDLFTTPAVESNSEVSGDVSKDVTGHLASCIMNTGDSGGTAPVFQDAETAGSNHVSGTTDQGLQAGRPAIASHSEVEPAGGAHNPSKANVSTDNSSDPAEELPLDSIKDIRDLVVEIIEVEELVQRNPDNDQV